MPGTLYIVSTPIGNLEDITFRAIKTLSNVDIIACEDTRTTKKLLNHYDIKTRQTSYHEFNEKSKAPELVNMLKQGLNIALVTDSGTPLISDPGYNLIRLSAENDIKIVPIPGPAALIAALCISGLRTSDFLFLGFLPRTRSKLCNLFNQIKEYPHTLVYYESPRRVAKSLGVMLEELGDRNISLSRELTKVHEEIIRGKISEVLKELEARQNIKGEFTIVAEGNISDGVKDPEIESTLEKLKNQGKSLKESVQISGILLNESKSKIYKIALRLWDETG